MKNSIFEEKLWSAGTPPTLDELLYESEHKRSIHPSLSNGEVLDDLKQYLENDKKTGIPHVQQLLVLKQKTGPFRLPNGQLCHYGKIPKVMSSSIDQVLASAMPWLWIGAHKSWSNPSTNRKNGIILLYTKNSKTSRLRLYNDPSKAPNPANRIRYLIYINLHSPIGKTPDFHCLLPKKFHAYTDAPIRFCVVRDPVERFFSAWMYLRNGSLNKSGKLTDPEEFFHVISHPDTRKKYRKIHHLTQTHYLGEDPRYYTHIFPMHDVPRLKEFLSEISGKPITMLHQNRSKKGDKNHNIPAQFRQRIETYYAQDYKIWGKYF